jgi:hypothetical protein
MNNLPEGANLLMVARETLISKLRPLLGEEGRYALAMVANAMAIAAREAEAGDAPATAALARLDTLYGRPARDLSGDALRSALDEHDAQLARDIRAGRFDDAGEKQRALLEHLRSSVEARLSISNPKSLGK